MAKRESSDGKSLERLVKVLHEALKDVPNTQILHNKRLPYKGSKRKGQVDVIIKTKANGEDFVIAIECKDFGKPVSGEKVDAFAKKCERLEGIDRVIVVSVSGFQPAAEESAKYSGVRLYNIKEVSAEALLNWIEPDSLRQITHELVEIKDFAIVFGSDPQMAVKRGVLPEDLKTLELDGKPYSALELILLIEFNNLDNSRFKMMDEILKLEDAYLNTSNFEFIAKITTKPPIWQPVYITHNGTKFPVQEIIYVPKYLLTVQKPQLIKSRRYFDFLNNSIKADFFEANMESTNLLMIQPNGNEAPTGYVSGPDGKWVQLREDKRNPSIFTDNPID
ncbi:restriction endonuclease [Larkinella punicea]|uniref:Restriction endonuclease type IV Mrr domain-containing protein n=1 Tax=Larkinella punicea TaxID=2315727 RepID=A0A368JIB8_9BACT|nr:restriction endonuclease [Larkinella punicea]RCR65851.1 hypothetical protein DUE52_29735 [Larkinella punicea]